MSEKLGHNEDEPVSERELPEFLLEARKFGENYTSFLEKIIGEKPTDDGNGDDNFLKNMKKIVGKHTMQAEDTVISDNMTAKDFLEGKLGAESDESKYRLKKLSDGIYAVYMDPDIRRQLAPGAEAQAVIDTKVPYILISDMSKEEDQDYAQRYNRENILHETNHLVWEWLEQEGLLDKFNGEKTFVGKVFLSKYKEEIICRLCSGGATWGYVPKLSDKGKDEFEKENPGEIEKSRQKITNINEILETLDDWFTNAIIKKTDLIKLVLEAKTFEDLEAEMKKVLSEITK